MGYFTEVRSVIYNLEPILISEILSNNCKNLVWPNYFRTYAYFLTAMKLKASCVARDSCYTRSY